LLNLEHIDVILADLHVVLYVLQSRDDGFDGPAHIAITLHHMINLGFGIRIVIIEELSQTNLSSIFFYFGPETGPNGAGVSNRQHDVVVGSLLSVSSDLDPTFQKAPKTPLDITVRQQSMPTNPFEGLDPTVEALLVAKIHSNDPTHKSLR
jgi:hypothetical protein